MSKRTVRALRAGLLMILVLLMVGTAVADSLEVRLNADTKVYESASTSSRAIKASKDLKLSLTAFAKGWGKVSYKGHVGYVKLKYLDLVDPVKAYVSSDTAVYKTAGGSKKLTTAAKGTIVYIVGVDGNYVHVKSKSGAMGYIKASALSASRVLPDDDDDDEIAAVTGSAADAVPASLRSSTTSSGGSKIEYTIYVAQNLIGAPYAADANPPKTFDCARFTHYCYDKAQSGAMKGSSLSQGNDDRYQKIDYDGLKRGDLVCFDTVSDEDLCDHVGIYIGDGYFIHASSAARKVILSSLKSGYYKRTFSWARRIFAD